MTAPTLADMLARALGRDVEPDLVERARRRAEDAPPLTDARSAYVAGLVRGGAV